MSMHVCLWLLIEFELEFFLGRSNKKETLLSYILLPRAKLTSHNIRMAQGN